MKGIYLDYASTTPLDGEVLEAMTPYLTSEFGNADSLHSFGRKTMSAIDKARDMLAEDLGVSPSEIYFTSGGTESDNWAIFGLARAQKEVGKTHVVVSSIEHHAVLSAVEELEREGFSVTYVDPNKRGMVEPNAFLEAIRQDTGLVAVMHANNETGVLQPVEEIAKLTKEKGIVFFSDCVQSAPYVALKPREMGVDALSISAHKFYGPKGIGALYVKKGVKIKNLHFGGEQERGKRGGTLPTASIVGLAHAYRKSCLHREVNNQAIASARLAFEKVLLGSGLQVTVNGEGNKIPSVLNVQLYGVHNTSFLSKMDLEGVALSAGAACASASLKPSETLLSMGLTEAEASESVRFSFGKHTTVLEAEEAARIAVRVIKGFGDEA